MANTPLDPPKVIESPDNYLPLPRVIKNQTNDATIEFTCLIIALAKNDNDWAQASLRKLAKELANNQIVDIASAIKQLISEIL